MKTLLTIIFLLFSLNAWGVNYYVDADCATPGDGTTSTCNGDADDAWDDISDISGLSAGDTVSFDRGDTWREQLTVGASGTSGNVITFNAYGTGNAPIISGADLIGTWADTFTAASAGSEEWSDNFDDNDLTGWDTVSGGVTNQNGRLETLIESANPDFILEGITSRTEYWASWKMYINTAVANTKSTDGSGLKDGPERIMLGFKNDSGTLKWQTHWADDSGTTRTVSSTTLTTGQWYDIVIHWKSATGEGQNDGIIQVWVDNVAIYNETTVDNDTLAVDQIIMGNGYTNSTSGEFYQDDLNVGTSGSASSGNENVWSATVATAEPNQVWFDGIIGTNQASAAACTSARDWYWDSNTLYVYSASDPDTAYTSPGVEAAQRTRVVYVANQDYVTFDGLTVKHSNGAAANQGALISFNHSSGTHSNGVVQNCTLQDSNWAAINVNGDTTTPTMTTAFTFQDNTIHDVCLNDANCGAIFAIYMDSSTIQRNIIYDTTEHAIRLKNSDSNTVQYNKAYNNGSSGFTISDGFNPGNLKSQNNIVRYNLFYGNDTVDGSKANLEIVNSGGSNAYYGNVTYDSQTYGLRIDDCAAGDIFYNNIIYNSDSDGIFVDGGNSTDCTFKNNIIMNSGGEHINFTTGDTTNMTVDYNFYYPDGAAKFNWSGTQYNFADWKTNSSQDTNSSVADPIFNNAAADNFSLQSTSPAINAGTDLGATYDDALSPGSIWPGGVSLEDQDKWGSGWEIGAYVYLTGCCRGATLQGVTIR